MHSLRFTFNFGPDRRFVVGTSVTARLPATEKAFFTIHYHPYFCFAIAL